MKQFKTISKAWWNLMYLFFPKQALYHISKQEFKSKLMDPTFPWKKYDKEINPYFKKWGFKFSSLESEYYRQCTGVESDLYIPLGLFNHMILPLLNNMEWRWGFADKNVTDRMLNVSDAPSGLDIKLPETIVGCQNGRFYLGQNQPCSYEEALDAVLSYGKDFIIKPSLDSSHGNGVKKVLASEISASMLPGLFKDYGKNFAIQKVLVQHPVLAAFNPTSINTVRITTYQDFKGEVKILYAAQRFGGKGKIYDNADDPHGSGGFCAIAMDGTIDRKIHHYRNMKCDTISDDIPEKIPYFEKLKETVIYLHRRFPHYGLIGWDTSLTPDGNPIVIEYNFVPGMGTGQLANFPIFSKEDLDEIMKRVCKMRPKVSLHVKNSRK